MTFTTNDVVTFLAVCVGAGGWIGIMVLMRDLRAAANSVERGLAKIAQDGWASHNPKTIEGIADIMSALHKL